MVNKTECAKPVSIVIQQWNRTISRIMSGCIWRRKLGHQLICQTVHEQPEHQVHWWSKREILNYDYGLLIIQPYKDEALLLYI